MSKGHKHDPGTNAYEACKSNSCHGKHAPDCFVFTSPTKFTKQELKKLWNSCLWVLCRVFFFVGWNLTQEGGLSTAGPETLLVVISVSLSDETCLYPTTRSLFHFPNVRGGTNGFLHRGNLKANQQTIICVAALEFILTEFCRPLQKEKWILNMHFIINECTALNASPVLWYAEVTK